jgi:cell wall-associated NlpC family hydrolase
MQEKVSAIIPVNSTDKKIVSKVEEKTHIQETNLTEKNPTISMTPSILDELALSVQNSMDIEITGDKKTVTQAIEVGSNWEEFTKNDEILETAKEYLGIKYLWAANGPSAFDCSGYTKYVFKQNGITLPRYSGHQANVGVKINFNELEKGDLVFFDTAKGFHGKVNHVGIYIGENQFIHASSARKKVMITSFSQKKFYKNRFLHGRRVVDSDASFAFYKK